MTVKLCFYVSPARDWPPVGSHNAARISSAANGWMVVQVGGFVEREISQTRAGCSVTFCTHPQILQHFRSSPIHCWCHRRDYFQTWRPPWHWSRLHGRRWKTLTGDAYLMLEQIIWFQRLTDQNPAAALFLLHSSHILTWSQSINQSLRLCVYFYVLKMFKQM